MSYLEAEIKVCSYFSYPIFSCEVRVVHRLNICDNLYFEPADQHVNKEALKQHEAIFICWTISEQKFSKCLKYLCNLFSVLEKRSYKLLYIKLLLKNQTVFNFSKAKHHTSHFSVSRLYRDMQMRIILLAMKISSMSIHDLPEEQHGDG